MAKIRGNKEGYVGDPTMAMPIEQKTEKKENESNKQKIAKISDLFPPMMKDNIAKILQFYDDDENKVIDAITRDGGQEALKNWAETGSLKSRTNKNKKKKRKGKKDFGSAISATASFDADDSSSIHSGGNVDIEPEKDSQTENGNGVPDIVDENKNIDTNLSNHEHPNDNEAVSIDTDKEISPHKLAFSPVHALKVSSQEETAQRASFSSDCNRSSVDNASRVSPLSDSSEKHEEQGAKKDKFRSINENYNRHSPRQRTSSFRRNKSSSVSEDSSSQHNNPQAAAVPTKRGYDKCKKDLNRQAISLQRIQSQIDKGFEDSEKRLKNAFADIIKQIENRQKEVESELAKRKVEAFSLLKSRQDLGAELKRRVDRTSSLSDAEWSELRSDIKQFVTERKYDDDLGKTIWFQWPDITETIKTFGEVAPVKNVYSQRSHSTSENAGSTNNPEPSPSSSLANEENESSLDKNDVANIADAVEDDTPIVEKEEAPIGHRTQPNEMRNTRIYQNTRYQRSRYNSGHHSNSNHGYFHQREAQSGYQQRPYPRNHFNKQPHFEEYNRGHQHPHLDRDPRMNDYPGDRNHRDYKNNRNHRGRGGANVNYRYNNRYNKGGNVGGPRHNVEHSEVHPPPASASAEKSNVVNGFVNN